ncbi:MAG: 30S ribosome-binding factor RbfA [Terriglobia bacterium]
MSYRIARLQETFKEEIGDILQKGLKDPRIGFVSVTSVDISPDLRHCKIFVSILGDDEQREAALTGLNSARGFIRQELGKRVRMKFLPEITVKLDKSIDEGFKISELIDKAKVSQRDDGQDG